ncbi:MerC domain-containing protein [Pseudoalteromonas sp. MMG013]|uniref:MerC domain-containing protein n=1 Tax=Pseudoalteromonas sp. MMG013 TaxID=2822687 RepID=UPI001B36D420|nr:MerC domain-containing protein [Pseudoalteromonas sp. MMG013]MBQ4862526.1 MerC domain-containing protein [Pseudoalteromonas sp. MMG013]
MKYTQKRMDQTAIGISMLCIAHCIFLPLLLVLVPSVGLGFLANETVHQYLVCGALVISFVALSIGCKRHNAWHVLIVGLTGLSCLVFAVVFGHDVLGEMMERVVTLIGSGLIIACHIRNYRLCAKVPCT